MQQSDQFWYTDPKGNLQGPCDAESLYNWYHKGYFEDSLQVSRDHGASFHPLRSLLKTLEQMAGTAPPPPPPPVSFSTPPNRMNP